MINRKQKIDLLKGIAKGSRSISEIEPLTFEVWFVDENSCTNAKTGEIFTRAEYDRLHGKEKAINVTLNIE